jgi:L-ascorbate metabolism protein UlaG (beta-lactamase superfamily)
MLAGGLNFAALGSIMSCGRGAMTDPVAAAEGHYRSLRGASLQKMALRRWHHANGRFRNPFSDVPRGRLGRALQWKLFSPNHFEPFYRDEPKRPVSVAWAPIRLEQGLSVTYLKHASVLIKDVDAYILVDPIFGGIFWFIEDFTPLAFSPRSMPPVDYVLITHGHYDHLDLPSLAMAAPGAHVLSPLGYAREFSAVRFQSRRAMDWYDRFFHNGREFVFLPCNHWSMRNPLIGPNTGLWGSYLIRTRFGATIYVAGDTGYFDGFEQIGAEFDIDLAIFNLGAYEPRWFMAPSHMNPAETVQAFRELGARRLMIVHWGTFRLGDEPVHFPPNDLRPALAAAGLESCLLDLEHGQTFHF